MLAPLAYRDERLFAARFVIDLNRELYRSLFPADPDGYAGRLDVLMVACCVTIGHAEGRPMNATKISHFLGLPRNTVRRRLAELIEAGAVTRRANAYLVSEKRMREIGPETFARIARLFRAVADAQEDLAPLFAPHRPKWTL